MDPRLSKIERDLAPLLQGEVRTDPIALALFSTAACIFRRRPLAVVSPANEEDVAQAMAYAAANEIAVTPRGGGSSLAGQALGPGIVLDFSAHMNRILAVDPERRAVRVEPGAIHGRVQKAARPLGLRLGPDPSSGDFCTLGANVGTNAAGAHTLRHGATKDHLLGLNVVLHDGTVVTLGEHAGGGERRDGGSTWRAMASDVEAIQGGTLRFGAWNFFGAWSLGFGAFQPSHSTETSGEPPRSQLTIIRVAV